MIKDLNQVGAKSKRYLKCFLINLKIMIKIDSHFDTTKPIIDFKSDKGRKEFKTVIDEKTGLKSMVTDQSVKDASRVGGASEKN